jgi:hypothetical protein
MKEYHMLFKVLDLVSYHTSSIANVIAAALASFMYGIVLYIWNPDNEELRETGRKSMFWGIIGMFVMVSVFGIMRFIISSIGADAALMNYV